MREGPSRWPLPGIQPSHRADQLHAFRPGQAEVSSGSLRLHATRVKPPRRQRQGEDVGLGGLEGVFSRASVRNDCNPLTHAFTVL